LKKEKPKLANQWAILNRPTKGIDTYFTPRLGCCQESGNGEKDRKRRGVDQRRKKENKPLKAALGTKLGDAKLKKRMEKRTRQRGRTQRKRKPKNVRFWRCEISERGEHTP